MDFMKAVFNKVPDPGCLHLGDVLALWDVARNKLIGLPTLSIYYRQARDKELKDLVKDGIEMALSRHVDKIQKMLKTKGYDFPAEINWEKKIDNESPFVIPSTIIDDEEIAMSLREIIRLTLTLEAEALRNATDSNVRELMVDILNDDNIGYSAVLAMQRKKGWRDFPPVVFSH